MTAPRILIRGLRPEGWRFPAPFRRKEPVLQMPRVWCMCTEENG